MAYPFRSSFLVKCNQNPVTSHARHMEKRNETLICKSRLHSLSCGFQLLTAYYHLSMSVLILGNFNFSVLSLFLYTSIDEMYNTVCALNCFSVEKKKN